MSAPVPAGGPAGLHPPCHVCGSTRGRESHPVLWPALVAEWQLTHAEAALVDQREGDRCVDCACSIRSQAVAAAITNAVGAVGPLAAWTDTAPQLRLLEVNAAGTITPWLTNVDGHQLVAYPEVDIQALPFEDATWDLVVHSETVEHVDDPVAALRECRRVLVPGGAMCFSLPMIPGRLTRRRDELPPSFHGLEVDPAYRVVTEFGADFWTIALDAGFSTLTTVNSDWPISVAYVARP